MSADTPLSHAGIAETACPTCMAPRGSCCRSNSGRLLKETHMSRVRAAMAADPVRAYVDEATSWRRSS